MKPHTMLPWRIAATLLILTQLVSAFFPRVSNFGSRTMLVREKTVSLRKSSSAAPDGTSRRVKGFLSLSTARETPSWRLQLDDLIKSTSPWGSASQAEILASDLLKRLPEVAEDVTDAARRGALLSEVVLAPGTEARYTVDGLKALNRQFRQDILPQALEAAPRVVKATSESLRRPPSLTGIARGSTRRTDDGRTGLMEGVAQTLYTIRAAGKNLTPQKVNENLKAVSTEALNVISRTPEGLYTPEYTVEVARADFQVRRYRPYAVASAPMTEGRAGSVDGNDESITRPIGEAVMGEGVNAGSGEGFNTLAGYLFGNNTQERAMSMTTPVNIDVSPAGGRTMSFVMPKEISAAVAPTPRNPRIGVSDVADGETLAVCEFPGFATDGEVRRQVDALLKALEREFKSASAEAGKQGQSFPWRAEDPSGATYRLMQYNPPYTLPWLRTNAVAVKVVGEETVSLDASAETPVTEVV